MIKLTNLIPEINIKPNRPYQVGDYFITVNSKNQEPCVITSIRDGNVYYDSIDEYWGKDGNYRPREEFDRFIKDGSWKIIPKPKDIDEIKIQPQQLKPRIGRYVIFKNATDSFYKTYKIQGEYPTYWVLLNINSTAVTTFDKVGLNHAIKEGRVIIESEENMS